MVLVISDLAAQKLDAIVLDLERSASVKTAQRFEDAVTRCFEGLLRQPHRYPPLRGGGFDPPVRVARVMSFRLAYRVDEVRGMIVIASVRHEREHPDGLVLDLG